MPQEKQSRNGKPRTTRLGWEQHWDPHPICWLVGTLAAPPYAWRGLGMRACPSGGVAITLPGTDLLVGAAPVDRYRVTWSVHTHDPLGREDHEPIEFGSFTWTWLEKKAYDKAACLFRLADGSVLRVADTRGQHETRYRIVSRANPTRLISGTESWADLAAIEQIAEQVYRRMRTPEARETYASGVSASTASPGSPA